MSVDGAAWTTPEEIATHPDVEIVIVGTVGAVGLGPTLAALEAGKVVALANKEVLVMAGGLVRAAAERGGGSLRPVDSEHSALWQCLWGEEPRHVARLILTASGGALRDRPLDELAVVTPVEVLRHPTWVMGSKITVDCATLLNKGMETIEARWLFDVPLERIDVVQHRESIVHSLVEFTDGSVKAQLGLPDMKLPIQCALTYPERLPVAGTTQLNLAEAGALHFAPVDFARVPCLRLAMESGRRGGTYPAVLAAADEIAVDRFLGGRIGFMEIPRIIESVLDAHAPGPAASVGEVLDADRWARVRAAEIADAAPVFAVSAPRT
jgi:1-deoxy-D-xylulose-5-phosphate reductoisomerase